MLEQEIKELGFENRVVDKDFGFTIVVVIPEWDIEETTIVSEDYDNWYVAPGDQPGWDEYYPKGEWSFEEAIRDFYKPADEN